MIRIIAWFAILSLVLVSFSGNAAAPFDRDVHAEALVYAPTRAPKADAPPDIQRPDRAAVPPLIKAPPSEPDDEADTADSEAEGGVRPAVLGRADLAPRPTAPTYIDELVRRLNQVVTDDKVVGLAVAVLEAGQPVLIYTHGETAAGSGEPVTSETVFRAASVSKTFTGTLLGLLEAEGLVDLDMRISGEVMRVQGARQPNLLELVSHRSGLPPNAFDLKLEEGQPVQRIRDQLSGVSRVCAVGECYTYQNIAFSAVEEPIEAATGMTYAQALETYVFRPFGLPRASVGTDQLVLAESWARPHRGWRRTVNTPGRPESAYDKVPGAGGVNVSLDDMIAWAQVQLGLAPGLPETVRERIHYPHTESVSETRRRGMLRERISSTWYGMGWRIYDWEGRTLLLHQGYLSGYGAQIVLEPETGFAFVALWNSDNRPAWWIWPTAMDLHAGTGPGNWLDRLED